MFVTQKKPNGWTLFFAFTEIAFGLWAFVAGFKHCGLALNFRHGCR
nr:MAG TPA_asm: hypothetical protein [Caudoviricetes sp.]